MLRALANKICALTLHKYCGFMFTSYLDGTTLVLVAIDRDSPIRMVRIPKFNWISTNIVITTQSRNGDINLIRKTVEHGYVFKYVTNGLEDDMLVHIAYKISLAITSVYMDVTGISVSQLSKCFEEA